MMMPIHGLVQMLYVDAKAAKEKEEEIERLTKRLQEAETIAKEAEAGDDAMVSAGSATLKK